MLSAFLPIFHFFNYNASRRNNKSYLSEIKAFYPAKDTYFGYFKPTAEGVSRALALLEAYIEAEGPFDGAIGFSQGAALISTYLLKWASEHPGRPLPLQCAIFFSASRPLDIDALRIGELKWAESDPDKAMLLLPTAHIWGAQDDKFQDQCKALSSLCDEARREVYIHGEGHEIPGPRARADVQGALRAIRRAIETASSLEH